MTAVLAVVFALASLAAGAPTDPGSSERMSTCAEARAAALVAESADALEADVDGDGAADRVFIVTEGEAPARCRHFLVAETGTRAIANAFRAYEDPAFEVPRLLLLAEIDRRPGAEPVVLVWQAPTNTRFAAVFALRHGEFVRMRLAGSGGMSRHAFPFFGIEFGVDCRGRGRGLVRSLHAGPAPPRYRDYRVETTLYRLRGTVFRIIFRRERRLSIAELDELDAHPVFGLPFRSCTVAAGATTPG